MFARLAKASDLVERLDAEYFTPDFIQADAQIAAASTRFGSMNTLEDIRDPSTGLCYGVLQPEFASSGIPAIEMRDMADGMLYLPELRIPGWQHKEYIRSAVIPGDLLITVKGTLGRIAIAPEWFPEANVNRDIARLRIKKGSCDVHYLFAFLSAKPGYLSLQRIIRGTIQRNLNIGDLLEHEVLLPSNDAQHYIGAKARQADRLRTLATIANESISRLVASPLLTAAMSTPSLRCGITQVTDLEPRLDGKFYNNRAIAVLRAARTEYTPIRNLIEDISNGFEHREFCENGSIYLTVTEVSSGRLDAITAPHIPAEIKIPEKAIINERCVLVVRTGSVGVAVKVYPDDVGMAISSHLIRLQCASEQVAASIAAFLNGDAGKVLLNKISYGAVQPQIGQDELLSLPVPKHIIDAGPEICTLMTEQEKALRSSQQLIQAAKLLVEALIEGTITEADLLVAAADPAADRALLARLTRAGLDVADSTPLFPDAAALDALVADTHAQQGKP